MKMNGVEDPCCICGRPTKNKHEINCQNIEPLNPVHGKDCSCLLIIGDNCLKKIRKHKSFFECNTCGHMVEWFAPDMKSKGYWTHTGNSAFPIFGRVPVLSTHCNMINSGCKCIKPEPKIIVKAIYPEGWKEQGCSDILMDGKVLA